jgi:hypothetical protein
VKQAQGAWLRFQTIAAEVAAGNLASGCCGRWSATSN